MIWNEDALRTTWDAAGRPLRECCESGAAGLQKMAMAPRFILEAFGLEAPPDAFRYMLITCLHCRRGTGIIIEAPSTAQDLPWRPPHVNIPECQCTPPNPQDPAALLQALKAHDN